MFQLELSLSRKFDSMQHGSDDYPGHSLTIANEWEAPPSLELPAGRGEVIVRLYENEIPASWIQMSKNN